MSLKAIKCLPKALITGAIFALLSTPAFSTTLNKLDFDEMVSQSDIVVLGEVVASQSVNDNGSIYTISTVNVSETLKGDARSQVTVKTPGGSVKSGNVRIGEVNAGAPSLLINSQKVLFLTQTDASNLLQIVGFGQGDLTVLSDGNAQKVIAPSISDNPVSMRTIRDRIQSQSTN